MGKMLTMAEIGKPRKEVLEGKLAELGILRFYNVIMEEGLEGSPQWVLSRTYPTKALRIALTAIRDKIRGKDVRGGIDFEGGYGSGKSHALGFLYHFLRNPKEARDWLDFWKEKLGPLSNMGIEKFTGVAIDLKQASPENLWSPLYAMAKQKVGEVPEEVKPKEERSPTLRQIEQLIRLIGDDGWVAIFYDELESWMNEYGNLELLMRYGSLERTPWWEQNRFFIEKLSEFSNSGDSRLILLMTTRGMYTEPRDTLSRVNARFINPVKEDPVDSAHIVRHRIFEEVNEKEVKTIASNYLDNYKGLKISVKWSEEEFLNRFSASYPLHPYAYEILSDKVMAYKEKQHVRGILYFVADMVLKYGSQLDAMLLGDIDVRDDELRSRELMYLGAELAEQAFHDITDMEELIEKSEKDPEQVKKFTEIAANIISATLIHSFSGESPIVGATREEIILSVMRPNQNINDFDYVLDHYVTQYAARLAPIGNRYIYGIRNPEAELAKETRKVLSDDAWRFIERNVRQLVGKEAGIETFLYEASIQQLLRKREKIKGKSLKVIVAPSITEPIRGINPDSWLFKDLKEIMDYQNTSVVLVTRQSDTLAPAILSYGKRAIAAETLKGNVASEKRGVESALKSIKKTEDRLKYERRIKELEEVSKYADDKEKSSLKELKEKLSHAKWYVVYTRKQTPVAGAVSTLEIEPLSRFSLDSVLILLDKVFGLPVIKEWTCRYLRTTPAQQVEYSTLFDGFYRWMGWPLPYSKIYDDIIAQAVDDLLAPRIRAEKLEGPCTVIAILNGIVRCKGEISKRRLRNAIIKLGRAPPPPPEFEADFVFDVADEKTKQPIEDFVVVPVETIVKAQATELKKGEILKAKLPKHPVTISFRISAKGYDAQAVKVNVKPEIEKYEALVYLNRLKPIQGVNTKLLVVDEKTKEELTGAVVLIDEAPHIASSVTRLTQGSHKYKILPGEDYCSNSGTISVEELDGEFKISINGAEVGLSSLKELEPFLLTFEAKPSRALIEIPYGNPAGIHQLFSQRFQDKVVENVEIEVLAETDVAARNVLGAEDGLSSFKLVAKYNFQGEESASLALATLLKLASKNWAKVGVKALVRVCQ